MSFLPFFLSNYFQTLQIIPQDPSSMSFTIMSVLKNTSVYKRKMGSTAFTIPLRKQYPNVLAFLQAAKSQC